jgi:MFS family permease
MSDGGASLRNDQSQFRTPAASRRRAPIWALLSANVISQSGSMVTFLAIPWFVLVTTGSAAQTGLVAAVGAIGHTLATFFGGTLVDRLGFKRISIAADVLAAVAIGAIPLLHDTVGLAFWQLLALTFLANVFDAPGWTARGSLMPELAALGRMQLERANAINQGAQAISQLLGPPLAGLLIAALGAGNVLWFDAASFGASALLVLACVPALDAARTAAHATSSYIAELREGLGFLAKDRLLRAMLVVDVPLNALGTALGGVILPVYARDEFNSAAAFGAIMAGFGGGMLVGVVAFGAVGARISRRLLWVSALVAVGVPIALLALNPPLWGSVAATALVGLIVGPINPMTSTVLQERVPVTLRGRVMGANNGISSIAAPLGAVGAGVLLAYSGTQAMLVGIALAMLLCGLASLAAPAFRLLDERVTFVETEHEVEAEALRPRLPIGVAGN